jgi:uncharacterized protein
MNITQPILQAVLDGYRLTPYGTHGLTHWARVLENGRRLAAHTSGVSLVVVELFAVFHDARRENEGHDHDHGLRGAELAFSLRGSLLQISDAEFDLLYKACALHTAGQTEADVSVQVCWDADRLDLSRAGITPSVHRLCTPAARNPQLIAWASARSIVRYAPPLLRDEWAL